MSVKKDERIAFITGYSGSHGAGLERFLIELLKSLDKTDIGKSIIVYTKKGNGLRGVLREEGVLTIKVEEIGFGKFWKDVGLLFAPRADLYMWNGPLVSFFFRPRKSVVILYDFAYKYFGTGLVQERIKNWWTDYLTKVVLKYSKVAIAISEATKDETVKFFGTEGSKIQVIYPGLNNVCALPPERVLPGVKDFFLFVGTLKERKNAFGVIKAYSEFKKGNGTHPEKLIIVGKLTKSPYVTKMQSFVKAEGLEKNIIFAGHVSDNELSHLYKNAKAFVFPSFLEGFGFPVTEAFACGIPVITSNQSSLKEVAGDAAILANPYNIVEIATAMERVVIDSPYRMELIRRGYEEVKKFSWENAGKSFAIIFEKVLNF